MPWLLVLPAGLVYAVVELLPALATFGYSLTDWNGLDPAPGFVGVDNFVTAFTNPRLLTALTNTLLFTLVVVVVQNLVGLALALAVHRGLKTGSAMRIALFAPVALSPLVVAYVWQYMYAPQGGAVNEALAAIGLGELGRAWLGDPSVALMAIAVTVIWQHAGYSMVIFLAGLEGIPEELHEAATIDRAGAWARFRHITLPLLAPAFTINLVISAVSSLKLFDQVIAMTGGGPGYATETVATVIYKQAFSVGDFASASALGVLLTALVVIISIAQLRILRRREEQAGGTR
ncbi:sugar ABC transporter permease [Amycolatopsis dongchuanensis]|uniref:Sugar ABC transporter permease n=1 Tax=Amycolatopsis dongchuanensis TaxID=1070866 RepID=A0ABP9QBB1_9PSEU